MAYPTNPEFSAVNVKSRASVLRSETKSGRTQSRSIGAQRWAFTAKYNDMTRDEFAPVYAFVISQDGSVGEFDVTPPVISGTRGDASGSLATTTSAAIGESSITVTGITGSLKTGDFIKFANHSKVYMLTAGRSGGGVMEFTPPLLAGVGSTVAVEYQSVPFRMRLENDIQEFDLSGYDRYQFEIDLIEVI